MQNAEIGRGADLLCGAEFRAKEDDYVRITVRKLTHMAILTAAALIVFIIEAQIPLPLPLPGAKLGLANTVTLFALFWKQEYSGSPTAPDKRGYLRASLTVPEVFMVLVCRIILGAVFTGRIIAFFYSAAGGMLAFAVQAAMKKIVSNKQIWACGAVGAIFHNIGQIIAAVLITGTQSIAAYLPALIAAGIVTGIITGLITQFAIERLAG